jgi:hypothetical protein
MVCALHHLLLRGATATAPGQELRPSAPRSELADRLLRASDASPPAGSEAPIQERLVMAEGE